MFTPSLSKEDVKFLRKRNAKRTALSVLENLDGLELSDVISEIFIKVNNDDEITKTLVRLFESQILLAMTDPEKFLEQINNFCISTSKFIKKNNLYANYLMFSYHVYKSKLYKNCKARYGVLHSYAILILEVMAYMPASYTDIIVGTTTKGKALFKKEPYQHIDYPGYLISQGKIKSPAKCLAMYKELGFDVSSPQDLEPIFMDYRIVTNTIMAVAFLIDETNVDILPINYSTIVNGINLPNMPPSTELNELMQNRSRMLDNNSVLVEMEFGDIESVNIYEKFVNDELFLLLKFNLIDDTSFMGFYDIMNDIFYTPFTDCDNSTAINYVNILERLVKEIYLIETANLPLDNTGYAKYGYRFIYKTKGLQGVRQGKSHNFTKEYESQKVMLQAYVRKLPVGSKASESAINEAKKYGINLKPNETFVKPFQKSVFKLK